MELILIAALKAPTWVPTCLPSYYRVGGRCVKTVLAQVIVPMPIPIPTPISCPEGFEDRGGACVPIIPPVKP